jgi:hypothetical protein
MNLHFFDISQDYARHTVPRCVSIFPRLTTPATPQPWLVDLVMPHA